jgi:chromosome segregation ATPase
MRPVLHDKSDGEKTMRYPESETIDRIKHDYAELVGQYDELQRDYDELTKYYAEVCDQKAKLCREIVALYDQITDLKGKL